MYELSDVVEAYCPFAEVMGVSKDDCRGEGIVWKVGTPLGRADPRLWYKTKGVVTRRKIDNQAQSNRRKAKKQPQPGYDESNEEKENVKQLAECMVTERRVEQGLEYLHELNLAMEKRHIRTFLLWVVRDVMREEVLTIEKSEIDQGLIKREVEQLARARYLDLVTRMESRGSEE